MCIVCIIAIGQSKPLRGAINIQKVDIAFQLLIRTCSSCVIIDSIVIDWKNESGESIELECSSQCSVQLWEMLTALRSFIVYRDRVSVWFLWFAALLIPQKYRFRYRKYQGISVPVISRA